VQILNFNFGQTGLPGVTSTPAGAAVHLKDDSEVHHSAVNPSQQQMSSSGGLNLCDESTTESETESDREAICTIHAVTGTQQMPPQVERRPSSEQDGRDDSATESETESDREALFGVRLGHQQLATEDRGSSSRCASNQHDPDELAADSQPDIFSTPKLVSYTNISRRKAKNTDFLCSVQG
jgi:hypothetical protein